MAVMNLNDTNIFIFLGYDWLTKHNSEVNWDTGTIKFTRCPKICRIQHQDIYFTSKNRKAQSMDN